MTNSDDNSGDDFRPKRPTTGNSSARSQSKSILKNSYKRNDSDEEEEQEYNKNSRDKYYGNDDMKRYGSPVNSSRSVSNKPPTGRLQAMSSRDQYESGRKLSPLDKAPPNRTKTNKSFRSDNEDDEDNDAYSKVSARGKYNSGKKNSDSDENEKKRFGKNSDSEDFDTMKKRFGKQRDNSDDDDDPYKNKSKKNSARNDSNSDEDKNKRFTTKKDTDSRLNKWDYDPSAKNGLSKYTGSTSTGNKPGSLSNRTSYDDDNKKSTFDLDNYDIYKSNTKTGGLGNKYGANSKLPSTSSLLKKDDTDDDFTSNKKLSDSLRLEQDVDKEYEKIYSSTRYDKFDLGRSSPKDTKSSLKSPKSSFDTDKSLTSGYTRTSNANPLGRNPIPLPAPNRATSLDRVGSINTNSAYNSLGSSKSKFNSSNNLNYLETMSDKSTASYNGNLSIREAKSRSFLVGSLSSAGGKGLLGTEELDRHLVDRKARVMIVTYNMAEMKTLPEKLEELVLPDNIQTMPDIYAIGCQEFVLNQKDWEVKLQEVIGPSHVKLASFYHGSLGLNIFIKRDLIWFCSVVDTEAINLRNVKMPIRTKASLVLSFQLFGTLMCFLCSHFESGDDKLELRIENYKTTVSNITLPKSIDIKNRLPSKKSEGNEINDHTQNFDCVFWFGDFNFRSKKAREVVENKVSHIKSMKSSNYEDLLNHDELHQILNNNKAFAHFVEPRIMFEPTYKYDLNTDTFDTSELCRIPSYTDRIVYRSKHKNTIQCTHYDSVRDIKSSDHRPVYCLLEVTIRPGVDKVPLGFGDFDREVYIAGYKKRQMYRALDVAFTQKVDVKPKSKIRCPIQ